MPRRTKAHRLPTLALALACSLGPAAAASLADAPPAPRTPRFT
jgi:hypothetical protein